MPAAQVPGVNADDAVKHRLIRLAWKIRIVAFTWLINQIANGMSTGYFPLVKWLIWLTLLWAVPSWAQPPLPSLSPPPQDGKARKLIRQKLAKTPRQTGTKTVPMAQSSSINSKSIGINLIVAPPVPTLTFAWDTTSNAVGYVLTASFNGSPARSWNCLTNQVTVSPPAGFPYVWTVAAYDYLTPWTTNNIRLYSAPSSSVSASPNLATNTLSLLVTTNGWNVAGLLNADGRLLSSTNLANWQAVAPIPAGQVTVVSEPLVGQQRYFRLASP